MLNFVIPLKHFPCFLRWQIAQNSVHINSLNIFENNFIYQNLSIFEFVNTFLHQNTLASDDNSFWFYHKMITLLKKINSNLISLVLGTLKVCTVEERCIQSPPLYTFSFFPFSFPHVPLKKCCNRCLDWTEWHKSGAHILMDRWKPSLLYKLGKRFPKLL